MPSIEAMLMIEPLPRSIMCLAASRESSNTACRLSSTMSRNASMSSSTDLAGVPYPALLTSTSMRPKAVNAASITPGRVAPSARSAWWATTFGISSARAARRSARRATASTLAPFAASTRVNRSPNPLDAPVTMTTRSWTEKISDDESTPPNIGDEFLVRWSTVVEGGLI